MSRRATPAAAFSLFVVALLTLGCDDHPPGGGSALSSSSTAMMQGSGSGPTCNALVTADVVAFDQVYTYNRHGSFNPVGMVYALKRDVVAIDDSKAIGPGNARLRPDKRPRPLVLRMNVGDCLQVTFTNWLAPTRQDIPGAPDSPWNVGGNEIGVNNSPATRTASFHVNGLHYLDIMADGAAVGYNPSSLAEPGETQVHTFYADREGTHLAHSMGAIVGGEGNGGQIVHGLFGAVNVQPPGSVWYRSQVTGEQLAAAQQRDIYGNPVFNPDGTPRIDYDAVDADGVPILRMLHEGEIVHSDLNAIIAHYSGTEMGTSTSYDQGHFREFTVLFHDELKTVQAFDFLEEDGVEGVADHMGINYGSAGLGAMLLANRAQLGPTSECYECMYEEFFLTSWANGDPAMNVDRGPDGRAVEALYPDDPSNVVHSYLGDPVRMRNVHAGPRETHVFHLHAHQWLYEPNQEGSNYLDSQTLAPGAGFTYDINYGGSGNRNLTPGDSIYHCHLYPHFAGGMWALWRVHDVFEAGTPDRNLPDGEIDGGTPNPAVVPIPGRGMPPMPTYEPVEVVTATGETITRPAMPGYPFYVPGIAGRRAPQPPMDLEHDGGLPRHIVTSIPFDAVQYGRRGDFDVEFFEANIKLLPDEGTPLEQSAMAFHAGGFPDATLHPTPYGWPAKAYPAFTPEGEPSNFLVNGLPPKPGAPFADPCPPGAPERIYRAAMVQIDKTVNSKGWHDPQARIMVLEEDVEATLSGQRPPEPFFFRANSGDCIVFSGTNLLPGHLEADDFQIFTPTDTVGNHIHLVKFDVMASDGSGNGFNYEDGIFAAEDVVKRIQAANALGGAFIADGTLDESGERVLLQALPHPRLTTAPLGAQTGIQRWWADPLTDANGVDRTIQTVFTHDHFAASSHQQHGLYGGLVVTPADAVWRDPQTGEIMGHRADGGPTSWRADIIAGPNGENSYREFNLAWADFALVYDDVGEPVNPAIRKLVPLPIAVDFEDEPLPEVISEDDPGTGLVNYRQEPIPLRIAERAGDTWAQKSGDEGDMAFVFSSHVHGDPFTPLLHGYRGDRVQINLIQGAHEEAHAFAMNAAKWRVEPGNPDSGYTSSQSFGISEHFEFVLDDGLVGTLNPLQAVDYLYTSPATDSLWNGMWGLMRAHGVVQEDLLTLPNNAEVQSHSLGPNPCPPGAVVREYDVHAITAKDNLPGDVLWYNRTHDLFDPDAVLYVRAEHLQGLRDGSREPEPLILRANAGDCIKVTLHNDLPEVMPDTPHWNFNPPITRGFNVNQVTPSRHASLHPQLLQYDPNWGDSANAGYNRPTTVPPGEFRTYQWYAGEWHRRPGRPETPRPIEFGVVNLRDMADVVNHGMRGAGGVLIVEPQGATWQTDPGTEASATITYTDANGQVRSFREFVLVYQNEVGLHSSNPQFLDGAQNLNSGTALRNRFDKDDAQDTGHMAFNYKSEPIWARLGLPPWESDGTVNDQQVADIFNSHVHGDPETPVFVASAGDEVRFRLAQPSGHPRVHAFTLHGTQWPTNPFAAGSESTVIGPNPGTYMVGTQGGFATQMGRTIVPSHGAGGPAGVAGDYLFREQKSRMLYGGIWGIFRVEL